MNYCSQISVSVYDIVDCITKVHEYYKDSYAKQTNCQTCDF